MNDDLRAAALVALAAMGIEPRHADDYITQQHGHYGVCCCMLERCHHGDCNVNLVMVKLLTRIPLM